MLNLLLNNFDLGLITFILYFKLHVIIFTFLNEILFSSINFDIFICIVFRQNVQRKQRSISHRDYEPVKAPHFIPLYNAMKMSY